MIDSRDFIAARKRADAELHIPAGTRIAFTGGLDCNDHRRIWAALDKAREKHADIVLLHGGSPKGAERIAACWADHHKVPQIVFKPDWTKHGKAAPFKRNDQLLEALPAGLVAFPGSGISANLADKAKRLGIAVWRFTEGAAYAASSADFQKIRADLFAASTARSVLADRSASQNQTVVGREARCRTCPPERTFRHTGENAGHCPEQTIKSWIRIWKKSTVL
jgi:hypothetical protein